MSSNKSGTGLILLVVLVVGLLILVIKHSKSSPNNTQVLIAQQVNLPVVEANLLNNSATAAKIRKNIQDLQDTNIIDLIIKVDKLPNPVLGQTSISISPEGKIICVILLNVETAVRAGDRVEPLLGHEFKHVWDTLYLYDKKDPYNSALTFIQTVKDQAGVLYANREVESSAINIENLIRQELKKSKNPLFTEMPETRYDADILYVKRSQFDPTLKKVL